MGIPEIVPPYFSGDSFQALRQGNKIQLLSMGRLNKSIAGQDIAHPTQTARQVSSRTFPLSRKIIDFFSHPAVFLKPNLS